MSLLLTVLFNSAVLKGIQYVCWSSVTLLSCVCVYAGMDECSSSHAACVLSAASQETCSRQAEC